MNSQIYTPYSMYYRMIVHIFKTIEDDVFYYTFPATLFSCNWYTEPNN